MTDEPNTAEATQDNVLVPRNLLAAACHCVRKHAGVGSETYRQLSVLSLASRPDDRPMSVGYERIGGVLKHGGNVGVPGVGEQVCPTCDGAGQDAALTGCDDCDTTGVVPLTDYTPDVNDGEDELYSKIGHPILQGDERRLAAAPAMPDDRPTSVGARSFDEWTEDEVRQSVRASVDQCGHNVFARSHGISSGKLSEFLSGNRGAEPGIIEPCGYRWALVNANDYPRREDQEIAAAPAMPVGGDRDALIAAIHPIVVRNTPTLPGRGCVVVAEDIAEAILALRPTSATEGEA